MRAIRIRVAGLAPILGALAHTRDDCSQVDYVARPSHSAVAHAVTTLGSPATPVALAPPSAPSSVVGWPAEVIVGRLSAKLKQGSSVTGNVAVTHRREGHGSSTAAELELDHAARISGSTAADTILLARTSRIAGGVRYNQLLGPGTVDGARITPLVLPLVLATPTIPNVRPGQTDVVVRGGETRELQAGSYDDIELRPGSILRLRGGLYPVENVSVGTNSRVECSAACVVVVEERFGADAKTFIGPRPGSGITSANVEVLIEGKGDHDDHGGDGDDDDNGGEHDAVIGSRGEIHARLFAPSGSLVFGSHSTATGTFVARDVIVGEGAVIAKEDIANCSGSIDDNNPCTADACDPSTGVITHTPLTQGTSCANQNACDGAETCNGAGVCTPGSAVVCAAPDQCHDAGVCNPASGACTNPPKANGTTCNDSSACTQSDTCQAGACVGSSPVVCTALDQCHDAGVCDPASGACTNPPKQNGATCSDSNACTQGDTCQRGACVGSVPVVCMALSTCHDAGICNPATGACTNPPRPNGTSCSDGSACTQSDTCQGGSCTGGNPVVCTASDQCHDAGTCDPSSGECSNPTKPDGVICDDESACTQSDTCQGGTCTGDDSVVCVALDQCHESGLCDAATGVCSNPQKPTGASCDDANGCTTGDSCQAGTCVSGMPVTCQGNDCHEPGFCDPATGACTFGPPRPDGTVCNDGTLCTGADLCEDGECVGGNPVVCVAQDACHETGTCDALTGVCSNPVKPGSICPPLPPDPATVAPPIDPTVATNLGDSTEFLYTGADPIQKNVPPGTIDRRRAAVLRGRVETREGAPLPGVSVTVHDHPEFGSTISRADGMFDLAVNGGGYLTVAYKKDGYLPAQRQVQAPWLDFAQVPDAALVPLDPSVTTIDLNDGGLQVARGSWMIDDSGARQMTLLFKPGTQATMTLADCTTEPLNLLSVRATEYTVGPNGPAAMPAALPATSNYTYAAELSADEAMAAGADRVDFSQPVVGYLTNFLGFPIGTTMPLGSYDRGKSAWIPEETGMVIGVLESGNDLADIDVDGDGFADDSLMLAGLGIDDSERRFLKGTYLPVTSLWRVEFRHFTPFDCNQPHTIVPAPGSAPPNNPPPYNPSPTNNPSDCDKGCVIEVENQILKESIPIVGTPITLEYRSDRVLGRDNTLRIPVTGSTLRPGLRGVSAFLSGAGRGVGHNFPVLPNQELVLNWDRRDAYDRPIQGDERITVTISYNYDGSYWRAATFGGPPVSPTGVSAPFGVTMNQTYTLDGNYLPRLPNWDGRGQGLGGWTVNKHHTYDPQTKMLRLGDGTLRTVESLSPEIATSAGTGTHDFSGDGGPAKDADLDLILASFCEFGGDPSPFVAAFGGGEGGPSANCDLTGGGGGGVPPGFALAADGSYYIADLGNCRVRRVDPDGIIETVAGTGFCDFGFPEFDPEPEACSEPTVVDRLALEVDLTPIELTVAPDGNVYIVSAPVDDSSGYGYGSDFIPNYEFLASKIFRLDVETGTIRRVAGNGFDGSLQEGVPATQAMLRARDVAVSSDGAIYIADTGNQRIRRVAPDGVINTVAGDGFSGSEGDGGPALLARFDDPAGIAIDAGGAVYIADQRNGRIRRLNPDGTIELIAGNGNSENDGAFPLDTRIRAPIDVALGPDGTVHYAEVQTFFGGEGIGSGRVRKITPEGTVETVAGVSQNELFEAIGQPFVERQAATSLHILPTDVDIAPDGTVYVEDIIHNRILRVAPPLPGVGVSDIFIPSEDAGEVFVFDKSGRHLRTVNPHTGLAMLSFSYDPQTRTISGITDANNNATTIQRDVEGNPISITSPYDQVTDLELDGDGYLSLVRNPADEESRMSYVSRGLLSTFTDPRGGLHQFAWNDQGRLIGETNPAGASKSFERQDTGSYEVTKESAMGRTSSVHVDGPQQGPNTTIVTHPDGTQTTIVMQKDGTIITTMPDGTVRTTRRLPDPRFGTLSPILETIVQTPGGITSIVTSTREVIQSDEQDPFSVQSIVERTQINGNAFESVYDAAARRTARTSPRGRQTFEVVDQEGRVTRRDVPGFAPTILEYNSLGRLHALTQGTEEHVAVGTARITEFDYNMRGLLETITDPVGGQARFLDYDDAGRARLEVFPGEREVRFAYDASTNVVSVAASGRPPHQFDHNPLDLTSLYDPPAPSIGDMRSWSTAYDYNADRDLELVSGPQGSRLDYVYDAAGRVTSLVYPSPINPGSDETIGIAYNQAGRVESLDSASGVLITYDYDGPLVTREAWTGSVSGSVVRDYDNHFRVGAEGVMGTPSVGFEYDADGLIVRAGSIAFARNPDNGLLTSSVQGGMRDALEYTEFGELERLSSAMNSSTLLDVTYRRDKLTRIIEKSETIDGGTTIYGYIYNAAGRLERVTKNGSESARYTYDANGNRLSRQALGEPVLEGAYDEQDRLIAYGDATYAHAPNGELLTRTTSASTTTYSYDFLGNLRRVVSSDQTIDYLIDGKNRRVGKRVNGGLVQAFLYANSLSPIAELDSLGNIVARFVYGTRINTPEYMIRDGVTYRIIADHVGSPRLVVDVLTGTIAQRMEYDEWGVVLLDTNPGFQPFGFAGGIQDGSTGLVRFGGRDYDPTLGRWTAGDHPVFFPRRPNRYTYAENDPINRIDPLGRLDFYVFVEAQGAAGVGADMMKGYVWDMEDWRGTGCFQASGPAIGLGASAGAGAGFAFRQVEGRAYNLSLGIATIPASLTISWDDRGWNGGALSFGPSSPFPPISAVASVTNAKPCPCP